MEIGMRGLRGGIAAAALLAASAASARDYYMYTGNGAWESVNYVNFYTSVPATTDNYLRYPFGGGADLKYYDYEISIPSGTACFEAETMPYSDPNYDTRIWTWYNSFRSLDDDSGVGAGSKARIWLSGSVNEILWVAAKSQSANTTRFEFKVKRLNLTESACTTGQSLPWVKNINGVSTYSANAN